MHTKTQYNTSVSLYALKESREFVEQEKAGMSLRDNVLRCLDILGFDLNTTSTVYGYVFALEDPTKLFESAIYNGKTRSDFKYKNKYETLTVLRPEKIPEGVKIVNREDLWTECINSGVDYHKKNPSGKRVRLPVFKGEE